MAPQFGDFAHRMGFRILRQKLMSRQSRPSRARGSKHFRDTALQAIPPVAPFTGAWIETAKRAEQIAKLPSRALHGRVDRNDLLSVDDPSEEKTSRPSRARGSKHRSEVRAKDAR